MKDLPTLMELIYAYFTGIGLDEQEFIATRDAMAGVLANRTSTPQLRLLARPHEEPLRRALQACNRS